MTVNDERMIDNARRQAWGLNKRTYVVETARDRMTDDEYDEAIRRASAMVEAQTS